MSDGTPLLDIQALTTRLETDTGPIRPVSQVTLHLDAGETLAVVGESGSGKSMLAFSIVRLLPPSGRIEAGAILWKGKDLCRMTHEELRRIRGKEIALVFQESGAALNPVRTIGDQLAEPLRTHLSLSRRQARERAVELLAEVRIQDPAQRVKDYPHQLSGGMKQRVLIAMAIACDPELVIADEPTTALDATLQARILELLAGLKERRNLSMLLITHDLALVRENAESGRGHVCRSHRRGRGLVHHPRRSAAPLHQGALAVASQAERRRSRQIEARGDGGHGSTSRGTSSRVCFRAPLSRLLRALLARGSVAAARPGEAGARRPHQSACYHDEAVLEAMTAKT